MKSSESPAASSGGHFDDHGEDLARRHVDLPNARDKLLDEREFVRWYEAGYTYDWMVTAYWHKYGLEVSRSMFSHRRRFLGLARRQQRDDHLIPWAVKLEHRFAYDVNMLRTEARRRAGVELMEAEARKLDGWVRGLERDNAVVHYDPDTERGWFHVARNSQDDDMIRRPDRTDGRRRLG